MTNVTEIRVDEDGRETHESWLLIRANMVSSSRPGVALFDSEIRHQHFIVVKVTRCTRERDLNRAKEGVTHVGLSPDAKADRTADFSIAELLKQDRRPLLTGNLIGAAVKLS